MFLGGADVVTAVTDTEVEPAVRSHDQPVQVVTAKSNVDSIAGMQTFAHVRSAIAVCVLKFPQIRNAGVVNIVADCQNPSTGSLHEPIESIGENGRPVHFEIIIRVD